MDTETHSFRARHASVLVIDDDPNALRLLVRLLTQARYEATAAFGAEDAMRKLSQRHYDFALVELAMKQVSGIHLIEMVKASAAGEATSVLAVTSPIRPSLMGAIGCDGFIFRPVDPHQLVQSLEAAGARHRIHQECESRG